MSGPLAEPEEHARGVAAASSDAAAAQAALPSPAPVVEGRGVQQAQVETAASRGRDHRNDWMVFGVLLGALAIVAYSLGGFALYVGAVVAIYATAALGLQVMVGLAGQLSLGHAAFLGVGAYVCVLLEKKAGVSFIAAAPVATVVAGLVGLLMAQLVRLSGIYFKIATFGYGVIVYQVLSNWSSMTGGYAGVIGIPPIELFGVKLGTKLALFTLALAFLALTYAILLRLSHGRTGRAFRAIGQNEAAAAAIGIPATRYKMAVISIGCAVAGLAGTLLPHLHNFLNPEEFTWLQSLTLLIMITVGGLGSLPGAIVGAVLLIVVPEYMRELREYKMLVFGILLVVSMTFLPRGIAGLASDLLARKRAR